LFGHTTDPASLVRSTSSAPQMKASAAWEIRTHKRVELVHLAQGWRWSFAFPASLVDWHNNFDAQAHREILSGVRGTGREEAPAHPVPQHLRASLYVPALAAHHCVTAALAVWTGPRADHARAPFVGGVEPGCDLRFAALDGATNVLVVQRVDHLREAVRDRCCVRLRCS